MYHPPTEAPKGNLSLRALRGVLTPLRRALTLVWDADARSTLAIGAVTLFSGLLPVAQAWVAKLIIDAVAQAAARQAPAAQALNAVLPYLYIELACFLAGAACAQLRRLLDEILNHKMGFLINSRIIRKALRLQLHYFENADFYDKMQNARRQSEYRAMAIVKALFLLGGSAITLMSFLALLVAFSPWVALLLFGATLPAFVAQTRFSRLNFRLQTWRAPEARRMNYLEHLLTVDTSVKEVKLFGLGEPLLARYAELFWKVFKEDERLAWRQSMASLGWGILATLTYYGCYAWVVWRTLLGSITLGSMTMYLAIFRQSQNTFSNMFSSINELYENSMFMDNLFQFLDLPETDEPSASHVAVLPPLDPQRGIELVDVSFRYQGQTTWALQNVTLSIAPGEKVALVGENGSGKTTLIKLLTRLYVPDSGDILYQGRSLHLWNVQALREKVGVIFQDFVRYQLTLRENVGFGAIGTSDNLTRLNQAARQGGMQDLLTSLDEGWETTLGGWFLKGRELSGGQWQKIALSRAFMRDGEVIVLDEPTSALDAEKEFEIFGRFKDLTAGKIAVLISHRFSTVRVADKIVVLKEGRIEELGSHTQLLASGGTYARLFEMQASGYR